MEPTSATAPHSGLGIASNLLGAAAAILLAVSLAMLVKAVFSGATGAAVTAQGLISLASMAGMGVAAIVLLAGFGLGVGGIMQPGRNPLFAITGTVINSSLLMTLTVLSVVGVVAAKSGTAKRGAAAAAASPARPAFTEAIDRLAASAALAGYEKVLVADLAADPARYESKKVALAGYYSGSQLQNFVVYGKWAAGGTVAVDGGQLSPEAKKTLLLNLDGFHMVFVRGVFKTEKQPPARVVILGTSSASHRLFADEVVDLGKDSDPK